MILYKDKFMDYFSKDDNEKYDYKEKDEETNLTGKHIIGVYEPDGSAT